MRRYSSSNRYNSNKRGSKKESSQYNKEKQLKPQFPLSNRLKGMCLLGKKRQWRPQCYKLHRNKKRKRRGTESRRLPSLHPQIKGRKGT